MDAGGGGGSSATGGADSGGSNSTGGAASGGSSSTGGAASGGSNSSGGTSGTGGSSSGVAWDEVRCWEYQETDLHSCYGRVGNLWTPIELACALESESRRPMDLSTSECSEDISTPWHETWCHEVECYGRLGDWAARLRAACEIADETPSGATPSEMFCAGAVEAPVGWDDVQCVAAKGASGIDFCWGFVGMYFPNFGLFPACYVEAKMAADPDFTEVAVEAGDVSVCP